MMSEGKREIQWFEGYEFEFQRETEDRLERERERERETHTLTRGGVCHSNLVPQGSTTQHYLKTGWQALTEAQREGCFFVFWFCSW